MNRDKLLMSIKKITSDSLKKNGKVPIEVEMLQWMLSHSSNEETINMIRKKKVRASSSSFFGNKNIGHAVSFDK